MYNGCVPELIELRPRIKMVAGAPGCPDAMFICRPGTVPSRALIGLASVLFTILSVATVEAAPVKAAFFVTPYPVTTTSSSTSVSGFNEMCNVALMPTSWLVIPINEITKVFAELGTFDNVNLPSMSVTVPTVVPFTKIEAPTTGNPSSSEITVPVTFVI